MIETLNADKDNPRRLWKTLNVTLGVSESITFTHTAEEFAQFFDDKISAIRLLTHNAPSPVFAVSPPNLMQPFHTVSTDDVVQLISSAPSKHCQLDPMPTWLLKRCAVTLGPFLTCLFNTSLSSGIVPLNMKYSIVTPLLKKPNMDQSDCASFRPVSNLSVIAKLLERIVSRQIVSYMEVNTLLPKCQSAYRANHSTETALLRVVSDLVEASDSGRVTLLALLDMSAAFDTVDHGILLQRLAYDFGIHSSVIDWIASYLTDRKQTVRCAGNESSAHNVFYGVPQGSVLGPLLFILYTAGLQDIIRSHSMMGHCYADDSQVYASCAPSDQAVLHEAMLNCLHDINDWTMTNRLKLNPTKTELMWCSTPQQRHLVSNNPFVINGVSINPSSSVKLLGLTIDCDLSMSSHVSRTVSTCFNQLRRLKSIRRSLPIDAAKTLVNSFVVSRLDYCNGVFAGVTQRQCNRMQSILNASARLLYGGTRREHVTPLLRDRLHWLKFQQRITYKLCLTVYKVLHQPHPAYLGELIRPLSTSRPFRQLRSADTNSLYNPRCRKKSGERGFSWAGPAAWNKLPADIRLLPSLAVFKIKLKTLLFKECYT
jgi:hypothetical protein